MKQLFIPFCMVLALFASCKKSDSGPASRAETIVGTWKSTEAGTDDNGNGTWEASERQPLPQDSALSLTFMADGSGSVGLSFGGFPVSVPMKWDLQNGDNDLRVLIDYSGIKDTLLQNIVSLSATDAVTRDQSYSPAIYTAYRKQ